MNLLQSATLGALLLSPAQENFALSANALPSREPVGVVLDIASKEVKAPTASGIIEQAVTELTFSLTGPDLREENMPKAEVNAVDVFKYSKYQAHGSTFDPFAGMELSPRA